MQLHFASLPALIKALPDDATARHYFESQRWDGCPVCPHCQADNYKKLKDRNRYRCGTCKKDFTVTTGTVFHKSHIGLHTWFAAMYLLSSHKKGISSVQLAKDIGITQKTAWFLLHRVREMYKSKDVIKLSGIVEADETYMGRKWRSDMSHMSKEEIQYRLRSKNSTSNKGAIFGMVARDGKIVVKAYYGIKGEEIKADIKKHITKDSWLITDGSFLYRDGLSHLYKHESVIHSRHEYVKGDIHTNNVECFWGVMKRGVYGIYHQISYKHLQSYANEFAFRYNSRHIKDNMRFELSLTNTGKHLPYKELTSNVKRKEEPYQEKESEWE